MLPNTYDVDAAFEAEEEIYSKHRTKTMAPPKLLVTRVPTKKRFAIEDRILMYFWRDPRDHSKYFEESPEVFSRAIAHILKAELPQDAREKMDELKKPEGPPFLIIRNLLPVPMGFPKNEYRYREIAGKPLSPAKSKRQRQMRAIDCVLGALLDCLGAEVTYRFPGLKRCSYDLTTRWDIQEAFDAPQPDMPLRFHQSTVERQLPTTNAGPSHTALYVAYGAIRNPRRLPILLLPVDTILETLQSVPAHNIDKTFAELSAPGYTKEYPRLSRHVLHIDPDQDGQPILGTYKGKKILSFDSSLVWVTQRDNTYGKDAINNLRKAIETAALKQAYSIKLRRHDVLLVNNLRAMVARSEETPTFFDPLSLPPLRNSMRRWLREMHGFAPHK